MTLLSEHAYCVTVAFKMTEQVEQWICIKFCIKLKHSSAETSDDSEGHSYGQLVIALSSRQYAHSCITSFMQSIFGGTSNNLGDSAPLEPRFGTL